MNPTFITGNQNKADYLSKLLGLPISHQKVDLDEIQSLDLKAITEHKARQAYKLINKPVLVEDVGLVIASMGRLPGPFIKWFLEELGLEGICRLVDALPGREAIVSCCYGYFDGRELKVFHSELEGEIAASPRGDESFGWNPIFIPKGEKLTFGEMTEEQFSRQYLRVKPISQVAEHLKLRAKA